MGNTGSIDIDIEDSSYYLRPKIDSELQPPPVKTQIDVCLACQQNSMTTAWGREVGDAWVGQPIDEVKKQLTNFLELVYMTTPKTTFTWTTWDVEDADIVLERDTHLVDRSDMFDVVVSMHCQYNFQIPGDTYRTMCRFLKPYGLFLEAHSAEIIEKRKSYRELQDMEALVCNTGSEMTPLFSIPPLKPLGAAGRDHRHFFELGLTIFQKTNDYPEHPNRHALDTRSGR